jgi:Zn-dependent peptidase ImmA (M78 family)
MKLTEHQKAVNKIRRNKRLIERLSLFGFGEKPLTKADFYQICRDEQIHVERLKLKSFRGFYFDDSRYTMKWIVLHSALRGKSFLKTAFHELGHYFLHKRKGVSIREFLENPNPKTKREIEKRETEANAFAALCLGETEVKN